LYGPPQVVTAPPYYGPYYGGYGDAIEGGGHGGYFGPQIGFPNSPNGVVHEGPVKYAPPQDELITPSKVEGLPAPAP
jgi:hypothetical protein